MEKLSKEKSEYFYFKKFKVKQPTNGLKITTDACVFGAFCAQLKFKNVIDIGTGTGVLSLMYSQKNFQSKITAIEIDKQIFENAMFNFKNSSFCSQIHTQNTAIQDYITDEKYDFIICNPPFFKNNLKGKNHQNNKAIHNETLSMEDLLTFILNNLSNFGKAAILYPPYESSIFETIANKYRLYTNETIQIFNLPHKHFRNIHFYSFENIKKLKISNFLIKNEENLYSDEMNELMKEFYL